MPALRCTHPRAPRRSARLRAALAPALRPGLWAVVLLVGLVGCQTAPKPAATLNDARSAYDRGDYPQALAFGSAVASGDPSEDTYEAAYFAGLSANEMGDLKQAIKFFTLATRGFDKGLVADANLMLGLAYSRQERWRPAAEALLAAARELEDQEQANAYFYAAVAEQHLGRWAMARDHLIQARVQSADPDFRQQIDDQLAINGYTLQIGSYLQTENAQDAANNLAPTARAQGLGEPRLLPNPARPGQTLVHVGRFTTYNSAQSYRDRLGVPGAFIVPLAVEQQ